MSNSTGTRMVEEVKMTNDLIRSCLIATKDSMGDAIPIQHEPNATYFFSKEALMKNKQAIEEFLAKPDTIDNRFKISASFMSEARNLLRSALLQLN